MTDRPNELPVSLSGTRTGTRVAGLAGILYPILEVSRVFFSGEANQPSWTADRADIVAFYTSIAELISLPISSDAWTATSGLPYLWCLIAAALVFVRAGLCPRRPLLGPSRFSRRTACVGS